MYVTYDSSIPTAVNPTPVDRLLLGSPYPNPGRGLVSFRLALPSADRAQLGVFDLSGRRVRSLLDENVPAGERLITWDGRSDNGQTAKSGVYFIRVQTPQGSASRRVLFLQ